MINKMIDMFRNKKIALLGFGKEGQSTYRFLRNYFPDLVLTIIDKKDIRNHEILVSDRKIEFVVGDTYLDHLEQYDLVIKSPGISLKEVDTSKIHMTSQIELLLSIAKDHVIGVTGTKGKTTTASLIYQILLANHVDTVLAGNMGIPVFSILDKINKDTMIVIEMSSHQLEYLSTSPHIGIVLNLFEDHLDHAGSVEHYHKIKMHMFSNQTEHDYMINFHDNETLKNMVEKNHFKGMKYTVDMKNQNATISLKNNQVYYQEIPVFDINRKIHLRGKHNLENIMVAYAVSKILKLDDQKTLKAIEEFLPIPYRLESIGIVDGVEYYIDTLATIPEATKNAVMAIENVNTLIFGGVDRGISYDGFAEFLTNTNIEHFICMPVTGHTIANDLPKDRIYLVETLEEACDLAKKITKKNTSCILSPAAASYNQFKNYEDKGDQFKKYIIK